MANEIHTEIAEAAAAADAWLIEGARTRDRIGNAASDNMRFGFIEGFKAARLRGEAAQGEQQAVATLTIDKVGAHFNALPAWHDLPHGDHALYTRPQPVAGDAVEAIAVALWHRFALDDRLGWEDESEKAIYRDAAQQVAALSSTAAPALRAGDARQFDGKWMVCTDPDMGRFISFDGQDAPAPVAGDAVLRARQLLCDVCFPLGGVGADLMLDIDMPQMGVVPTEDALAAIRAALAQDRASQSDVIEADCTGCGAKVFAWPEHRSSSKCLDCVANAESQGEAAGVPEGWRLVPVKPTPEMLDAGFVADRDTETHKGHARWAAMLAAAPRPAAERELG